MLDTTRPGRRNSREICLIDAGHFGTELPSLGALASDIGALAKGKSLEMELQVLVVQNDPWVVL